MSGGILDPILGIQPIAVIEPTLRMGDDPPNPDRPGRAVPNSTEEVFPDMSFDY